MIDDDTLHWNVDLEVNLFHAMRKHKPVGVNRHFQMVYIQDRLNSSVSHYISSAHIWQHLSKMYDLTALNESEIIPFPNKEAEFSLPGSEFSSLIAEEFPRSENIEVPALPSDDEYQPKPESKEAVKETIKGPKQTIMEKVVDRLIDSGRPDDSPKREHRKRTRQATQSPAAVSDMASGGSKRARRT